VQLAHPLIPRARAVANDISFGNGSQAFIVSGSNMSGKSTLLRSVGINAVLALAGAPVRATSLRLTPVAIGATLRVQDSLQAGRSRFYAEITRVRQLVDLARESHALLFLLDELFHGTNSHDRVAGAQGVLHSLLDLHAIGLVTTHDLALAAIADDLAPRVLNVHLDDALVAGEIQFDYRLKPGPVTRSNALALMKAVGLDVEG
jgi:DNA mismatch repair ATPase MutS